MAIKTKNNRYPVHNEVRAFNCSESPVGTSQHSVGSIETWDGVFSRPKPKRLKVTYYRYKEAILYDNKTSSCRKHSGGTSFRSGSYQFCHNAMTGTRYTFDSRSSISMATTLAKARFTSSSYAETLAESRRTSRMIGNRIGTLASLATAIKARNRIRADKIAARIRGEQYSYKGSQGKPISRRFADGWLEYQFGWLPLLSDIYDALDYYNNRLHRGMQVGRSYATNGGYSGYSGMSAAQKAERIREKGPVAKVAIRTRVSNPTLRTLSEMGLTNPMSLAWDLLPYSFVVDWVLPISSILKSLLYGIGLEEDNSYSVSEYTRFSLKKPSCCGTFVSDYTREVFRQPLIPGALPRIFTNPRDMGLWHIITSTALLRQQFNGGRVR